MRTKSQSQLIYSPPEINSIIITKEHIKKNIKIIRPNTFNTFIIFNYKALPPDKEPSSVI